MAFCNNQENHHIRGVHYLEYARVLIIELQVTLDGFNIVWTKQRFVCYELYCVCMLFYS